MARFKPLDTASEKPTPLTLDHILQNTKQLASITWGRINRRMQLASIFIFFISLTTYLSFTALHHTIGLTLPSVSLQYHYQAQASKFNESKLALLIENRPNPILAPLMLHFISVVPPDWRFRFMGSLESVGQINKSVAIREQVAAGKLDLTYIPSNMTTGSQEEISRFLTNLWLYETLLAPAEWLLVFQTDSILCANSRKNLNDYLEYDWVGAPWNATGRFGGNGGLSLRRVSAIVDVLRNQVRKDGSEPEDVWLTDRLGHRPGAKLANGTVSTVFSGEAHPGDTVRIEHQDKGKPGHGHGHGNGNGTVVKNSTVLLEAAKEGVYVEGLDDWREGFYEPMGYHTGGSGKYLANEVWGTPRLRKHIWDYCPEIKMTLEMDVAQYVPGECGARWKRGLEERTAGLPGFIGVGVEDVKEDDKGGDVLQRRGYETEIIDGVEYPVLLGLVPW